MRNLRRFANDVERAGGLIMNKKTINGVRKYYELPESISDEQIKKDLKGSIGEASVNIEIAKQNLIKAFSVAMPNIIKKFKKCHGSDV